MLSQWNDFLPHGYACWLQLSQEGDLSNPTVSVWNSPIGCGQLLLNRYHDQSCYDNPDSVHTCSVATQRMGAAWPTDLLFTPRHFSLRQGWDLQGRNNAEMLLWCCLGWTPLSQVVKQTCTFDIKSMNCKSTNGRWFSKGIFIASKKLYANCLKRLWKFSKTAQHRPRSLLLV